MPYQTREDEPQENISGVEHTAVEAEEVEMDSDDQSEAFVSFFGEKLDKLKEVKIEGTEDGKERKKTGGAMKKKKRNTKKT